MLSLLSVPAPEGVSDLGCNAAARKRNNRLRDNRLRSEGPPLGAGPRGVPAPPRPTMWTAATIAPAAPAIEPDRRSSEVISRHPPAFQARVPQIVADPRRSSA